MHGGRGETRGTAAVESECELGGSGSGSVSVCGSADKADDMGDWRVLAAAAAAAAAAVAAVCVVLLCGCVVRGLNECGGNARAAGRDGKESGGANGRAQEKCVCACVSRVLRKEAGWDGRK